ncbi:hypothetical protein BHM03_00020459 [Ensete ventricosum]|nr:hypothetical protein BHM03_00020459 [Ensete ventricosum]
MYRRKIAAPGTPRELGDSVGIVEAGLGYADGDEARDDGGDEQGEGGEKEGEGNAVGHCDDAARTKGGEVFAFQCNRERRRRKLLFSCSLRPETWLTTLFLAFLGALVFDCRFLCRALFATTAAVTGIGGGGVAFAPLPTAETEMKRPRHKRPARKALMDLPLRILISFLYSCFACSSFSTPFPVLRSNRWRRRWKKGGVVVG